MTKIEEIEDYFNNPALSQSKLKLLINGGVGLYNNIKEEDIVEEKDAKLIGSLVDDLFTYDEEEFNKIYHVGDFKNKPSGTILNIIFPILRLAEEYSLIEEYKDELIIEANSQGYGNGKYSDDRVWNEIIKAKSFWNEYNQVRGKQIISQEEYQLAKEIHYNIFTHDYTKDCFNITCKYQIPLYWTIADVNCKALIDMMCVKNKILYVNDFKVTANNRKFKEQVERFRYDIQQLWYMTGVLMNKEYLTSLFGEYNGIEFKFITDSYKYKGSPLIYKINQIYLLY